MKRNSLEEGSKRISKPVAQSKASAISKQVLKSNPIPQQLVNKSQSAATADSTSAFPKPKAQPLRSSKVSQKLVLFPQSSTEPESTLGVLPEDHEPLAPSFDPTAHLRQQQQELGRGLQLDYMNNEELPQTPSATDADFWRPHHATGVALPTEWTFGSRTAAERMPKDERDFAQLPRVAAYCTGEGYNLARLRPFLREHHHVSPRQYDEALYAAYHFPLMTLRPDKDNLWNIRVRSASPRPHVSRQFSSTDGSDLHQDQQQHPLHNSNNMDISPKQQQDETYTSDPSTLSQQRRENEESEMNFDEDHLDQEGTPIIGSASPFPHRQHDHQQHMDHYHQHFDISHDNDQQELHHPEQQQQQSTPDEHTETNGHQGQHDHEPSYEEDHHHHHHHDDDEAHQTYDHQEHQKNQDTNHPQPPNRKPFTGGEVFIFDYGVVVFWNFRRAEELLMLEDLAEFSIGPFRDNPDEDLQIEEMHFQYDTSQLKPRIFNDMITMKTGNHMIKLTLSHGLSQSAVLARYEDIMDKTIEVKSKKKEWMEMGH
ncbi:hypothetical protein [Absidia glauca]|uniref:DUF155 domain-containing protein n=1 Tax=Absidia glauca TaxID=4829 RepID=A0A163JSR2_ABSGL|nr:hypothetical protein [Absidia glauca]